MSHKVLFIDSCHPSLGEKLEKAGFICDYLYSMSEAEIADSIHTYTGVVIRSRIKLTAPLIDKAKNLRFIARVGAGMENIDVKYAGSKGIHCLHAPEGNRTAVAEHAMGMLLMLTNNLGRADREVREGKWIREGNRGWEIEGKTVGIIGFGNMGTAFAQRLTGFGVKILVYDKYRKGFATEQFTETSMHQIFNEADIVSLHLPLTPETHYLVNSGFIDSFRKPFVLINTSRGSIVNTADLLRKMEDGKITGACLDVLEYEGLSFEGLSASVNEKESDHSKIHARLSASDRVVLSPHIAGWTVESNEKMASVLAEKIIRLEIR